MSEAQMVTYHLCANLCSLLMILELSMLESDMQSTSSQPSMKKTHSHYLLDRVKVCWYRYCVGLQQTYLPYNNARIHWCRAKTVWPPWPNQTRTLAAQTLSNYLQRAWTIHKQRPGYKPKARQQVKKQHVSRPSLGHYCTTQKLLTIKS